MPDSVTSVVVALIGAAAPLLIAIRAFRKENDKQHSDTSQALGRIERSLEVMNTKIDEVETKIDRHLGAHEGLKQPKPKVRAVR